MKVEDYGRDLACANGLSYSLYEVREGRRGVAEAIARRLQTPALFYASDYGYDLRRYLGAATVAATRGQIEAGVEAEALKDERVSDARAVVTHEGDTLKVSIRLVTYTEGPFTMTLEVSKVTVELTGVG